MVKARNAMSQIVTPSLVEAATIELLEPMDSIRGGLLGLRRARKVGDTERVGGYILRNLQKRGVKLKVVH